MEKIKILSLFDGISGCRQALKELDIDCKYFSSEIDKYAIQVANANHPDIIQLGDVKELDNWNLVLNNLAGISNGKENKLDILIGGFPCQSFSIAGNRKGLEDERGQLFFEALRILDEVKPKYFIFENVNSMSKANKALIDEKLGIGHIMINSALVTAQQRKRIYWVGKLVNGKYEQVKIDQPEDKNIYFKDIISCDDYDTFAFVNSSKDRIIKCTDKASTLTATYYKGIRGAGRPFLTSKINEGKKLDDVSHLKQLTVNWCCSLQGFPQNYCSVVSATQGYKALGNSFTVPVIKNILKSLWKK